ncbi:MAG TPA: vWA domain-containing protein, partial [Gaiellaceae bacterium]|nr:vWA domain-containing protein [Gaiellaceae bacterium]
MRRRTTPVALAALLVSLIALATAAVTSASLSPASASFTLRAGDATLGTATEAKVVGVPTNPPKADIEIAIDTTGSMQSTINDAKADANAIVSGVNSLGADTQYAIVQFKDFCTDTAPTSGPGCTLLGGSVYPGDYPEYQVVQPLTSSATDVSNALNTLSADGGGDAPEAYNLVFHNSYSDPSIGWRAGTRKFVIVIGDAQPHGNVAAQGFAGCSDVTVDPHSLVTSTELAGMAANERTLMMIRQVSGATTTSLACYQSLAAAGFTGG